MAETHEPAEESIAQPSISRHQRYYALHREVCNAKQKEAYRNRPAVIAKRMESERKKAEKEAMKEQQKAEQKRLKEEEREKKRAEKLRLALASTLKVS